MQHGDMDLQHGNGHPAWNGHAVWTWTYTTNMDMDMEMSMEMVVDMNTHT
jgi:hypothetical protein